MHSPAAMAIWQLVRHHDIFALSVLIFIEETGIPLPLPGNILLMYLGMLSARGRVSPVQVVGAMTLASICGSLVLYCVAQNVGRRAVLRWGRYVGLEQKRVARIETWLSRYGAVTVGVGRIVPGLRTPTSAVGGVFNVPLRLFVPFTSAAAFLWTLFWVVLGRAVGRNFQLQDYISGSHMVYALLLAGAFLLLLPAAGVITARREAAREARERAAAAEAGEELAECPTLPPAPPAGELPAARRAAWHEGEEGDTGGRVPARAGRRAPLSTK